ncbi:MAG: hypothetical protein R6V05_10425 [Candidatus Brocadiia bacterium]
MVKSRPGAALLAAAMAVLALTASVAAAADYREPVGHAELARELGRRLPTGRGLRVTQVETGGPEQEGQSGWTPDHRLEQFRGVRFLLPGVPSGHATVVGGLFYGARSLAPDVAEVECFPAGLWAFAPDGFLRTGTELPPLSTTSRVANHSWVRTDDRGGNAEALLRLDWVAATDEFIQVAGANNTSKVQDLVQCACNAIVVGRSSGRHASGTNAVGDGVYTAGRAKPEIVAPGRSTSAACPMVASAAAMLVGFAHEEGLRLSGGALRLPRTGERLYHAETSEVIKAVLMAGADRRTDANRRALGNLSGYRRGKETRTDNGLDTRFGAGQLNVRNSYYILAAGEQDSIEDGGDVAHRALGFDYDPVFGGAEGSNSVARYRLPAPDRPAVLKACLAWNADISGGGRPWRGRPRVYDLDLKLYDLEWSEALPVAESLSQKDNTENIHHRLEPGHRCELRVVVAPGQQEFQWDYALAWQLGEPRPPERDAQDTQDGKD